MHVSPLAPWANYYVIVGSASAALTGLMFVVVTLITGTRSHRPGEGIATFSTPSVMHFCAALAVAATLTAPWKVLWPAALLLGLIGLWGLCYTVVVARRVRRQGSYQPVLEDWSWHVVFPLLAYVAFVIAALLLPGQTAEMLFIVGAATVLLLFIGIHNAWDNVTYLVVDYIGRPSDDPGEDRHVTLPRGDDPPALGGGTSAPPTAASSTGVSHNREMPGVGDAARHAPSDPPG